MIENSLLTWFPLFGSQGCTWEMIYYLPHCHEANVVQEKEENKKSSKIYNKNTKVNFWAEISNNKKTVWG